MKYRIKVLSYVFFWAFITLINLPKLISQNGFVDPASEEIIAELNRADSILFMAIFETCDVDLMRNMTTVDVEFYHDKWGLIATSREELAGNTQMGCDQQKSGANNRARRKLDKQSIEVYPLNNYGAIHQGYHTFYQEKNGKYEFTESAKFTHIWKKTEDGWQLARILSFDHKPSK